MDRSGFTRSLGLDWSAGDGRLPFVGASWASLAAAVPGPTGLGISCRFSGGHTGLVLWGCSDQFRQPSGPHAPTAPMLEENRRKCSARESRTLVLGAPGARCGARSQAGVIGPLQTVAAATDMHIIERACWSHPNG